MEIYIVQKGKDIILVTDNRGRAMDYLSKKGYTVSGHNLES
ncbi:hypothetical protein [Alkalihalophilus marmarensis]|nr:hypothetical protein [Alkalihalophilus marmarensis]